MRLGRLRATAAALRGLGDRDALRVAGRRPTHLVCHKWGRWLGQVLCMYMLALRRLQGASLSPRALRLWAVSVSSTFPVGTGRTLSARVAEERRSLVLPGSPRTGAAPRTTPRGSATRGSSWLASGTGGSRGLGVRDWGSRHAGSPRLRLRYACVVFLNNNCNFWASGP